MTPDRLTALLGASAGNGDGTRSNRCPEEVTVAEYVDGTLGPEEAQTFEDHLADCSACLALVGFLARERSTVEFTPVPAEPLARAAQSGQERRPHAPPYARYFAAAAVLVLAVATLVNVTQIADSGGTAAPDADGTRAVRGSATSEAPLQVLAPRAGATVPGRHLAFRWTAVPGSQYYEVRIVNDAGDVLADERVSGTQWRPHTALALRANTDYYVHVDAHLADTHSVGSEHVLFRVVP